MKILNLTFILIFSLGVIASARVQTPSGEIALSLRVRDPKTGQLVTTPLKIDPHKVGFVIVDPWNYHWCMTWTEQAGGMSPRMNRVLQGCRKLGMTVLWAPTDTASTFAGWPQRQRAMAMPYLPVPNVRKLDCHWTLPYGGCLCGPGLSCLVNYGEDGMDSRLEITESDLIVSGTQELYSICQARGISVLIYGGGAINICLTGKDVGLGPMYAAGLQTIVARDLSFAWTEYDPAKGYTPTTGNAQAAADLERSQIATVMMGEELGKLGLWDDRWITEPVRITPAGTLKRPYLFEKPVAVWLDAPNLEGAEIHYTLDGSEAAAFSPKFAGPIRLAETSTLRAAAFRLGRKVSLDGSGRFVRLPAVPPKPDVPLEGLQLVPDLYSASWLWQPKKDASYDGQPLRIRGTRYAKGYGTRAPAYLRFDLKPEWTRFVALAGVDDNMLNHDLGLEIAGFPLVVFKVFLDGKLAAESPATRISQAPWRFNVPIPPGSRQIVLVSDDAGARGPYNLGNWVEAGFVTKNE